MRVINKGKTKKHDCKECGCRFEYEGKDVETLGLGFLSVILLEPKDYHLKCPSCKIKIVVGRF